MDGKGRAGNIILTLCGIISLWACSEREDTIPGESDARETVEVILECPGYETKAYIPDEDAVNDLNLIIFEDEVAEESIWRDNIRNRDELRFEISLVKGRRYTICAVANTGRRIQVKNLDEWTQLAVELQESDRYPHGIPMSATVKDMISGEMDPIHMELTRMAAKISIRIDRSRLSKDVHMDVTGLRIGNCPKYVSVSGPSKALSHHDVFKYGFELAEEQCSRLNHTGMNGLSGEVSVYMLENMQGDFPYMIGEDEEKVLEEGHPLAERASFIELEISYLSSDLISYDSPLIYRFYLGDGVDDLDVERNSHYHVTVVPEDDGLSGSGWRTDKSGIGPSTPLFRMHPGEYVEGHVGDTLHIWCECYPKTSPFDPGVEELEYDKSRGIYDFKIDEDRHGVTLYLKKPGTGIVYMTAYEPINRSGMVLVCVYP